LLKKYRCPKCRNYLQKAKLSHQEHSGWSCLGCKGYALSAETTRALLHEKLNKWLWELAEGARIDPSIPCPGCQAAMREVVLYPSGGALRLNVCIQCKAVWLDRGEMEDIKKRASQQSWKEARVTESDHLHILAALKQLPVPEDGFKWGRHTAFLSALLLLFGVFGILQPEWALRKFSFIPEYSLQTRLHTWLACAFVHADWRHLFGNLYFLWIVGPELERALGLDRFFLIFALSVIGGNAAVYGSHEAFSIPHLGASGGISGLMAAFTLQFPHRRISIFHWMNSNSRSGITGIRLPMWMAFLGFMILQIVSHETQPREAMIQISYMSHIGGALTGLILMLLI
jgi:membrane associated rhomboid family serine protease